MIAAQGILTSRGGKTSHAAVVARGMGKTCVSGAEELEVDLVGKKITTPGGVVISEGDVLSIDGTTGAVFLGEVPVVAERRSCSTSRASTREAGRATRWSRSVHRLISHADELRRLGVRTNADTADDAARARRFGAQGIGLCRTEHMFLGDRRQLVEQLILADGDEERTAALDALLAAAARGLRRHLRGDGRAAGHRPADRPAAARVPARPHRAVGQGRAWPRPRARPSRARHRSCSRRYAGCTSRTRCSACAACGSAWSSPACSRCRCGRSPRPRPSGRRPAATRSRRSWSRWSARCRSSRSSARRPRAIARARSPRRPASTYRR